MNFIHKHIVKYCGALKQFHKAINQNSRAKRHWFPSLVIVFRILEEDNILQILYQTHRSYTDGTIKNLLSTWFILLRIYFQVYTQLCIYICPSIKVVRLSVVSICIVPRLRRIVLCLSNLWIWYQWNIKYTTEMWPSLDVRVNKIIYHLDKSNRVLSFWCTYKAYTYMYMIYIYGCMYLFVLLFNNYRGRCFAKNDFNCVHCVCYYVPGDNCKAVWHVYVVSPVHIRSLCRF